MYSILHRMPHALLWFVLLMGLEIPVLAEPLGEAEYALAQGEYEKAFAQFSALAKKGDPGAMIGLGRMYQGGHGVPKSSDKAMEWFGKGVTIWNTRARQGDPRAYASLGVLFNRGIAFKKDTARARQYFKSAFDLAYEKALQGDNDSQHLIGMLYSSGKGTQKDIVAGIQWLGKAAEGGNETAIIMLIKIYECDCLGIPKDEEKTEYWRGRLLAIENNNAL